MPLLTQADIAWPQGRDQAKLSSADRDAIIIQAEALVADELRLGTLATNPATPEPAEQGLSAITVTDYEFFITIDRPFLLFPTGPVSALTALSINDLTVDLASVDVGPWTARYRNGACFGENGDGTMTAAVGWANLAALPERIRAAVQLIILDLIQLTEIDGYRDSVDFGSIKVTNRNFSRERVHDLIGGLVSPWSRPQIF